MSNFYQVLKQSGALHNVHPLEESSMMTLGKQRLCREPSMGFGTLPSEPMPVVNEHETSLTYYSVSLSEQEASHNMDDSSMEDGFVLDELREEVSISSLSCDSFLEDSSDELSCFSVVQEGPGHSLRDDDDDACWDAKPSTRNKPTKYEYYRQLQHTKSIFGRDRKPHIRERLWNQEEMHTVEAEIVTPSNSSCADTQASF